MRRAQLANKKGIEDEVQDKDSKSSKGKGRGRGRGRGRGAATGKQDKVDGKDKESEIEESNEDTKAKLSEVGNGVPLKPQAAEEGSQDQGELDQQGIPEKSDGKPKRKTGVAKQPVKQTDATGGSKDIEKEKETKPKKRKTAKEQEETKEVPQVPTSSGKKPPAKKGKKKNPETEESGSLAGALGKDGDDKSAIVQKRCRSKMPPAIAFARPDLWKKPGENEESIEEFEENKDEVEEEAKPKEAKPARRKKRAKNHKKDQKKDQEKEQKEEQKEAKTKTKEPSEAKDAGVPKKKRVRASSPATFARRVCPKTEWGQLKWHALKRVFVDLIKPRLTTYSVHEDSPRKWVGNISSKSKS